MAYLGVECRKGEIIKKRVPIGEYNDGTPITLPVMTITGQQDGPTVLLMSGDHGDEVTGTEILHQLIPLLKPSEVRGRIVLLPISGIQSFVSRSRGWKLEERFTHDGFVVHHPGSTKGLMSERMAYIMGTEFRAHSDMSFTFHTSIDGFSSLPFTRVLPDSGDGTYELRKKLAYGSGCPYVWDIIPISRDANVSRMGLPTRFGGGASRDGKVRFNFEMGGSRYVSYEFVPIGVRGARRMLQIVGSLPGEPEPLNEPQRTFNYVDFVQPNEGGVLKRYVELGNEVKKGQRIADVLDVFGDTVEELVSPVDGLVFRLMFLHSTSTGSEVAWIAH